MAITFIRSSEVIKKLREFRTTLGFSKTDFKIKGAAEFAEGQKANVFVKGGIDELYVMISNSSASTTSYSGSGVEQITHNIDIAYFTRVDDFRGQGCDERAVWFKEFLLRALYGWTPDGNGKPLQFAGDSFNQMAGKAIYSRVYQYTQQVDIDQSDIETNGDFDDLDDFTSLLTTVTAVTPDFDEDKTNNSIDQEFETL